MGIISVLFIVEMPSDTSNTGKARIIRRGLLSYLTIVLIVYVGSLFGHPWRLEPFGFAILLACLGYVAAATTLEREEQLAVIESELELAKNIQMALLPAPFPSSSHF